MGKSSAPIEGGNDGPAHRHGLKDLEPRPTGIDREQFARLGRRSLQFRIAGNFVYRTAGWNKNS